MNQLQATDYCVHDWYRFVLSFPAHLVRTYINRFGVNHGQCVLDPFCGTGTTLVECKKLGIDCVGIEPNPLAHFATEVKLDWTVDPSELLSHACGIAEVVEERLAKERVDDWTDLPLFADGPTHPDELLTLPSPELKLLLKDSISPVPLHKILVLLERLDASDDRRFIGHERLALANTAVASSNLHFGPEVGIGKLKRDAPVVTTWLARIRQMATDLETLGRKGAVPRSSVYQADSRDIASVLAPNSVDAVITSPPYPNEKDYTRTTRLESVLLGFVRSRAQLRSLKQTLVRSNTRNVYKSDQDDLLVLQNAAIQRIADSIEERRVELSKTSGFERQYARVTKLYFGGMARHLSGLRTVLRPGAQLAYLVGDQASYLRVMIRTGQLLAEIAQTLGYEVVDLELFRTRISTATRSQLREEVLLLKWPNEAKMRGCP